MFRLRFFNGSASLEFAYKRDGAKTNFRLNSNLDFWTNFYCVLRSMRASRPRSQPMLIDEIFINQNQRLRSGWRFLVFLLAFVFFAGLIGSIVKLTISQLGMEYSLGGFLFLSLERFVSLAIAILLGWLCGKYLEDLPFRALGAWFTRYWLKDLILGFLGGALTLVFAVSIAIGFGGLRFDFNQAQESAAIWQTLIISLTVFIVAAAFEEAFFRGYLLQTFARAQLAWLAILLTSLFFAAGHLSNDNAGYLSTVNTALAGVWFSVAYLKTRTLWFPFGLHLMWNWFQGAIFGIEVSGVTSLTTAPLLREFDSGPIWLTGESYGIEGGIACTIAIIISTLVIWFLPILKPTEELLVLTSEEISKSETVTN